VVNRNTKKSQQQNLCFRCTTTAFLFLIFHTHFEKKKNTARELKHMAFRKEERKKNQLDFFIKKIGKQSSFLLLYYNAGKPVLLRIFFHDNCGASLPKSFFQHYFSEKLI